MSVPGLDEELHLHLLELARAEDEVARRDLVPERLADLRDAERDLLPRRLLDVQEVDVDALRRLGPEIHDRRALLDRPHERLEHQVELSRGAVSSQAVPLARPLARLLRAPRVRQLVGPEPALAGLAVDQRIGEAGDVAARLPHPRMHQDRRVEPLDVVARAHHRVPPVVLDVRLELDAERAVVPHRSRPAVDLRRLENEAVPLAQRHELVHHIGRKKASERGVGAEAHRP